MLEKLWFDIRTVCTRAYVWLSKHGPRSRPAFWTQKRGWENAVKQLRGVWLLGVILLLLACVPIPENSRVVTRNENANLEDLARAFARPEGSSDIDVYVEMMGRLSECVLKPLYSDGPALGLSPSEETALSIFYLGVMYAATIHSLDSGDTSDIPNVEMIQDSNSMGDFLEWMIVSYCHDGYEDD